MVQLPSQKELEQLESFAEPFCLTVYAPHIEFDPTGATNPNKIELKNQLKQAEMALLDEGVGPKDVRKTLRPARNILDTHEFWPLRNESLALFMHPRMFRYYHLPASIPYMLTIERGFNLEPLLKAIADNKPYLVLALSHKDVKMYQGDRFQIKELRLRNFPNNMEKSLNIDEYPKAWETHAIGPAGGGTGSEAFHGQYNSKETDKEMLFQFFRRIDNSLRKFLQKKEMPLILAGVEYLQPIYRQANTSPYLMPEGLNGNFEHVRPDDIRKQAWDLIRGEE